MTKQFVHGIVLDIGLLQKAALPNPKHLEKKKLIEIEILDLVQGVLMTLIR